jgi:Tol biopolymer transport system component
VNDFRTEIRGAFEREQSAFPPPAALRAQVVAAVRSHARATAPPRLRVDRNLNWLMVTAAALLTIAIVAALLAVRLMTLHPTLVKPGSQLCVPARTQASDLFGLVHGYITYTDGSQIWAVDPNHQANRISLGPSNGLMPIAWSRDGSRLLAMQQTRTTGLQTDLCVLNADGSVVRLTNGDVAGGPRGSFSPDGAKVVYERFYTSVVPRGHVSKTGLYVVDVKGDAPRLIADSNTCSVPDEQGGCNLEPELSNPAWSPDGTRIAYADWRYDLSTDEIWTMSSDGTNQHRLLDLGRCGPTQYSGCTDSLAWSPDGSLLAFHSAGGIYTVHADGSGLHRIRSDGGQPTWSPDGSRIAFTRGGELFTIAIDGSGVTLLAGVAVVPNYAWAWNPVP